MDKSTIKKEFFNKKEIWVITNKDYLISELNDTISDLKDEHNSTPMFFNRLENRIEKWKELFTIDNTKLP